VDGELFLDTPTALDFVAACQEKDLAVLGLEGFILDSGKLRPQLDMVADYSSAEKSTWEMFRDYCNRSAQKFLRSISPRSGLVFSIVIKARDEKIKLIPDNE